MWRVRARYLSANRSRIAHIGLLPVVSGPADHILQSTGSGGVASVQRFRSPWALQDRTLRETSRESCPLLVSISALSRPYESVPLRGNLGSICLQLLHVKKKKQFSAYL